MKINRERLKTIHKKILKNKFTNFLLSFIIYLYLKFVYLTSKKEYRGEYDKLRTSIKDREGGLICLWHSRVLMSPAILINIFRGTGSRELYHFSSGHSDGILATNITHLFGYKKLYGSSINKDKGSSKNKGSLSAIRTLVSGLKKGYIFAITPDGPRGPEREINGEIINIARLANKKIFPVSISYSRKKILKSWDKFQICLPFSKIIIDFGDAIEVNSAKDVQDKKEKLENSLNLLTDKNDKLVCQK